MSLGSIFSTRRQAEWVSTKPFVLMFIRVDENDTNGVSIDFGGKSKNALLSANWFESHGWRKSELFTSTLSVLQTSQSEGMVKLNDSAL
jgi:hypothetical protein